MRAPDLSPATKDLALVCCFAPLYTLFSFWPLAPIIGVVGKSITMAAVMAPLVGVLLGPYLGAATAGLGGIVGASLAQGGAFNPISFLPGTAAALCAGLLYNRKEKACYSAVCRVSVGIGPLSADRSILAVSLFYLVPSCRTSYSSVPSKVKSHRFHKKSTNVNKTNSWDFCNLFYSDYVCARRWLLGV